jgi:hypothetical protein
MTMKKQSLQSAILAMALMLGISTTMTVGHALVAPTGAQAGVLGKIKGAAKTVGKGAASVAKSGVKSTTNAVGGLAKVGANAAVRAGKGIGSDVKRTAVVTGKAVVKSPVGQGVGRIVRVVRKKI